MAKYHGKIQKGFIPPMKRFDAMRRAQRRKRGVTRGNPNKRHVYIIRQRKR